MDSIYKFVINYMTFKCLLPHSVIAIFTFLMVSFEAQKFSLEWIYAFLSPSLVCAFGFRLKNVKMSLPNPRSKDLPLCLLLKFYSFSSGRSLICFELTLYIVWCEFHLHSFLVIFAGKITEWSLASLSKNNWPWSPFTINGKIQLSSFLWIISENLYLLQTSTRKTWKLGWAPDLHAH